MKLFKIKYDECGYDQYDGFVIAAENKERTIELMMLAEGSYLPKPTPDRIEEIKINNLKEGIVLSSFNAG